MRELENLVLFSTRGLIILLPPNRANEKADDKKILDPKNWRGTNWLGEAIMKVREQIKNEE